MIAHGRGTMRALSSLIGILVSLELWVPAMAQSPLSAGRERALKPGDTFKECDACPEMVVVPAGSFAMGSPSNEKARDNNEGPQHQVTITRSFAFGKFEVTVDQFVAFVQETGHDTGSTCDIWQDGKWAERSGYSWRKPGFAQSGSHPAACLSWDDAKAYLSWLSRKTGKIYRLPAEAEWEYAARAGTETEYWWGNEMKSGMAICYDSDSRWSGKQTSPVGSFQPNPFGLYDTAGNVWEWVEDCWHHDYKKAPTDGSAWLEANRGNCGQRVLRGGSCFGGPDNLRASNRNLIYADGRSNDIGFRVAQDLD